jgi:CRP/FNR family transcriptional regulator, cyclic AMP receptor protein
VLLRGAQQREAAAGRTLHFAGDRERHVELVVQGLIRVHASAPDGRTLTIRYCRPGSLMGNLSLYAEPFLMPATTQALVDAASSGSTQTWSVSSPTGTYASRKPSSSS